MEWSYIPSDRLTSYGFHSTGLSYSSLVLVLVNTLGTKALRTKPITVKAVSAHTV